jgi:recombination protein RecT
MAAPKTDKSGQIQKAPAPSTELALRKETFDMIAKWRTEIQRALPRHVTPERMMAVIRTAFSRSPKLLECTPMSIVGSIMTASQLGLEPNTPLGHCHMIPFRNNRNNTTECTLILGYQGLMDLARRSKEISGIWAEVVRQGDDFTYKKGLNPDLVHIESKDADREDKDITYAYAIASMRDGEKVFVVLSKPQIEKYRNRSRAAKEGPWVTDLEAMCKKTAVRRLFTWLPKSIEIAQAIAVDEAPEIGKDQADTWTPEVTEAMAAQGLLPVPEPPAEPEPTGEMTLEAVVDQICKITGQKAAEVKKQIQEWSQIPKEQLSHAGQMLDDATARAEEGTDGQTSLVK